MPQAEAEPVTDAAPTIAGRGSPYDTVVVACGLLAIGIATISWVIRIGFDDPFAAVAKQTLLALFIFSFPAMVSGLLFRNSYREARLPVRWWSSYPFLWLVALALTAALRPFVSASGLNVFPVIWAVGIVSYTIVLVRWLPRSTVRRTIALIIGCAAFSLWASGVVREGIYRNPPVIVIPLFFGGVLAFAVALRSRRGRGGADDDLRNDGRFWFVFLAASIGTIPISGLDAMGVSISLDYPRNSVQPAWWPLFIVVHVFWSLLYILVRLRSEGIGTLADLREAASERRILDVEAVALIAFLGTAAVLVPQIGAWALYFSDVQRWLAVGFILSRIPELFATVVGEAQPMRGKRPRKVMSRLDAISVRKVVFAFLFLPMLGSMIYNAIVWPITMARANTVTIVRPPPPPPPGPRP